jgi:hypothetical protein
MIVREALVLVVHDFKSREAPYQNSGQRMEDGLFVVTKPAPHSWSRFKIIFFFFFFLNFRIFEFLNFSYKMNCFMPTDEVADKEAR